jgi:hypothetical protein
MFESIEGGGAGCRAVLTAAYSTHPERFVRKPPVPSALPATSWINPPQEKEDAVLSNNPAMAPHTG